MSKEAPKNPLLAIVIVVNLALALFLLQKQYGYEDKVTEVITKAKGQQAPETSNPHIPKPRAGHRIVEYPFGDFSVNLARPSGPQRFIKVSITFLVETPLKNDLTEIINKTPALRDEIIAIFNNQTPQDVLKLEGRAILKNLLRNHVNLQLKDDEVLQVLFTKFMIS